MKVAPFVGIPYQGERFCAVLVARVLAAHGIDYPDVDRPEVAAGWARVERPQPLDVVVFNRAGTPGHVGVCIGRGKFLHVEEGDRSCTDYLSSRLWARRIEGFYRHVGIA